MAFAQGSRARLSYGVQADFDTAATTFTEIPFVSESLNLTKEYFEGESLRSDRQRVTGRHGTKQVAGDITVEMADGIYDDFLSGVMFNDWSSDVLTVGTTEKYFTFEKYFSDIDVADKFEGCLANTMGISITPEGIIQSTFGFIGKDFSSSATEETVTAQGSFEPFDGFSGSISLGDTDGALSSVTVVTSIELNIDNGASATFVVGSDTTPFIPSNMVSISGTMEVYFQDDAVRTRFRDETETAISVSITDPDSNTYTFLIPRAKLNSSESSVGGGDSVMVSVEFTALRDDTEGTMLKITRPASA